MHSLLHDITGFLILFLEELFLIFNQMLSIRAFGRRVLMMFFVNDMVLKDDYYNICGICGKYVRSI